LALIPNLKVKFGFDLTIVISMRE